MNMKKIKSKQKWLIAAIPKVINEHNQNCVLCGRQIIDENTSVTLRKLDGTNYTFDSDTCMKIFQKLCSVYGSILT
jgi:formate dehydrogenase assembly factor FdhD